MGTGGIKGMLGANDPYTDVWCLIPFEKGSCSIGVSLRFGYGQYLTTGPDTTSRTTQDEIFYVNPVPDTNPALAI